MIRHMLFAGAAALSFPALAQDMPPAGDDAMTTPAQTEAAPMSDPTQPGTPDTATPPTDPTAPTPTDPTAPVDTTAPPAGEAAPSGTAATPTQVAQIVEQEFSIYDADASGELSDAEFGSWMKKLRAATDPTVDPESEAVKTWVGQAFAAADTDTSAGINKEELTAFLSRGA